MTRSSVLASVPDLTGSSTQTDTTAAVTTPETSSVNLGAWWLLALSSAAVIATAIQVGWNLGGSGLFLLALCFVVCSAAAWIDVATRRIPNVLTYPALLIGLGLNAFLPPLLELVGADVAVSFLGTSGFRDALLGFGLCAVIGIVSFIARGLGGGDVKLLAAVGAILGLQAVVPVLFNTLAIAAVIGVINWMWNGSLIPRVQVLAGNLLVALVTKKDLGKVYSFGKSEAPFGFALLLGLIVAQFFALHDFILSFIG